MTKFRKVIPVIGIEGTLAHTRFHYTRVLGTIGSFIKSAATQP